MIIQSVTWQTHRDELIRIRHSVFIDEQGIDPTEEWDEYDATALHILVTLPQLDDANPYEKSHVQRNGESALTNQNTNNHHTMANSAVACARLVIHKNGEIQIGRVAVLALYRHKGIGAAMLKHAIMAAWQYSYPNTPTLYLNAQNHLIALYQKLHFTPEGLTFLDAGIPHTRMQFSHKDLNNTAFFNKQSLQINTPNAFACLARLLTQQAVRHINIISHTLAPALYHQPELCNVLSQFVRSHRQAHIHIAVINTRQLGLKKHLLIELAQRIPSKIRIQKIKKSLLDTGNITTYQDSLVFDTSGFITLTNSQTHQGFGIFNHQVQVKQAQNHFDYIWQSHCEPEPNLRQLY